MSDTLNGTIGQPARFAGDYLFRDAALPNNTTLNSGEHTLNNTLGRLILTGEIDKSLEVPSGKVLAVNLQYKDGNNWLDDRIILTANEGTLSAGKVFEVIPVPSNTKRIYRLQVASNFDASDVNLTAAIEALPLA